jgi:hypothetical protein
MIGPRLQFHRCKPQALGGGRLLNWLAEGCAFDVSPGDWRLQRFKLRVPLSMI